MKSRPYQDEALVALYNYFVSHPDAKSNPVAALPTGTGKSVVIAKFIYHVLRSWPGQRIMVLTHVKELVEQNANKMIDVWPHAPVGIYSAGLKQKNHFSPITFAGIQSARNNPSLFGRQDLVIIDECHLVSPNDTASYIAFIKELRKLNPLLRVIGLSATPYRMGLGMITDGGLFTDICYDITSLAAFNKLIDDGYLSTLIPMTTGTTLDVEGVAKRGGEFVEKDLQKAVVKYDLTKKALMEAVEGAVDRKHWLIYATGIDHVYMISDILDELGISNGVVHSSTKDHPLSDADRDDNIARFKAGQIRALINANVLTTGFDFPALDCIILLRPTNSPVLHVQILGRGTRPLYEPGFDLDTVEGRLGAMRASAKQNCLVLDFAGNTMRLGPVNDPRIPKKKKPGAGDMPVKVCDSCGCMNHISARVCINCGEEFTFEEKITPKASTLQLVVRDEPQVELFKVDKVTYQKKAGYHGKPPHMRVSYFCGVRRFTEAVCIEHHHSSIIHKAQNWWHERSQTDTHPMTIDDALQKASSLRVPSQIRVWVNTKYPEILQSFYEEEPAE